MATNDNGDGIATINSTKAFSADSNYLVFNVTPIDSVITVDGRQYKPETDGSLTLFVSRGVHSYEVTAEGYTSEHGEVTVGRQRAKVVVSLREK